MYKAINPSVFTVCNGRYYIYGYSIEKSLLYTLYSILNQNTNCNIIDDISCLSNEIDKQKFKAVLLTNIDEQRNISDLKSIGKYLWIDNYALFY